MRKFMQNRLFGNLVIILVASAIVGLFFLGSQYWDKYQAEKIQSIELQKLDQAQKEQEKIEQTIKEQLRDAEINLLKEQLLALQNKPTETKTINNTTIIGSQDEVSSVAKEWTPRVAHIACNWYDSLGTLYAKGSGSATLVNFTSLGMRAVTNKHVVVFKNYLPRECKIELNDGKTYEVKITKESISVGESEDWALIVLPNDATLASVANKTVKICKSVNAGDKLVVLGYPKIGSKTGITVTEGIVSGIDSNYYITSAKIDKGNSGGAAILVKDSCYLGIPSASVVGQIESLGRILKASFVIGG